MLVEKKEKKIVSSVDASFREVDFIEPIEKIDRKGWVTWGVKNLYPQFLLSLYYNSPIHGGIVNNKVTFISSGGLKYSGTPEQFDAINKNGIEKYTLDELVEMYSFDQEISESYYILCKLDKLTGRWNLSHLAFELMRPNEYENKFYYSENWGTNNQSYEKTKYKEYTSIFNRTSETTECVLFVKKKSRQYTLENDKLTLGYFPIPAYSGGIDSIKTDIEINFFRLSEVTNGYKGGTLISLNNGKPASTEEADKIVKDLKLNASDKRKQGGIAVTFANGKEQEPSILQLNGNDLDKRYESTEQGLMQKIMIAHSVINPKLFSVVSNSFVDADLQKDFQLFQQTYVKGRQKNIEDSINYCLKTLNGMPGELSFIPSQLNLEQNVDEKNAVSTALNKMSPLVANKVLSNLTTNEIRALGNLPAIENGDTIAQQPTSFNKQVSDEVVLLHFDSCGIPKLGSRIVATFEYKGQSDEETIQEFTKQKFAKIDETQAKILNLLSNGESYDSIVKALNIKPIDLSKQLMKLGNLGMIDGLEVTDKGMTEIATEQNISILYSYDKRIDAPDLIKGGKSRPFCVEMIRKDKLYTREEITMISSLIGRDVWSYRGGWYHDPEKDINRPSCRHYWNQNVIIK